MKEKAKTATGVTLKRAMILVQDGKVWADLYFDNKKLVSTATHETVESVEKTLNKHFPEFEVVRLGESQAAIQSVINIQRNVFEQVQSLSREKQNALDIIKGYDVEIGKLVLRAKELDAGLQKMGFIQDIQAVAKSAGVTLAL